MNIRYFIKNSRILVFCIGLLIFLSSGVVFADADIKYQTFNPDSIYYPAKRVIEKTRMALSFSEEGRVNLQIELLYNRVAELKYLTDKKLLSYIEQSSQRVAYEAAILLEYVKSKDIKRKEETIILFNFYKRILGVQRDIFPANSSYWLLVQQDIDTLSKGVEFLSKSKSKSEN